MEILTKLFNFLLTENEFNVKITSIPFIFVEVYIDFLIITSLIKFKYENKHKILFIVLITISSLLSIFIIPAPFNAFLNYLILFIFMKYIFKLNYIKSILCTIFPTIVFALIGSLTLKPYLTIINLTYTQCENTPIYRLLYVSVYYFIVYLITILIKNINIKKLFNENFNKQNRSIILLNLIFGFFTLCIQSTIITFYIDKLPLSISFLNFISLLTYFFISLYSLNKTLMLQIATQNLENAENHNNTLTILYDNVRAFKHDFDNMVFTIGGFVNTNDMAGLRKYYTNLEKDCQRVNNIAQLNPQIINNSGIYNLLMAKYQKANEMNIEIKFDFFFDFNNLKMPIYDFSRMLGILLDNAIEAASEAELKNINIIFRESPNNKTQLIIIENTYKTSNIDKKTIYNKGISSKPNHSGMGLWEVKQILNRNNNINLLTDITSKLFKQQIEIYY